MRVERAWVCRRSFWQRLSSLQSVKDICYQPMKNKYHQCFGFEFELPLSIRPTLVWNSNRLIIKIITNLIMNNDECCRNYAHTRLLVAIVTNIKKRKMYIIHILFTLHCITSRNTCMCSCERDFRRSCLFRFKKYNI